jgi:glucose-1-phosphate cytidylyltransferase
MKVVILCGGRGTRLREETEFRPKPMLPIGNRPILWHIMKIYATHGHRDFILCLGYKGELIREYFRSYLWMASDVTLTLGRSPTVKFHSSHEEEDWTVTLVDTGEDTMTAGRIKRVEKYVRPDSEFFLTYGDGVGDVKVNDVLSLHHQCGKLLTLTAVNPPGRFGDLKLGDAASVLQFNEKPQVDSGWISGGFFAVSSKVFDLLQNTDDTMFEHEPMRRMTAAGELAAYRHRGFWQPMDTLAEYTFLNKLWREGQAPWKIW